MGKGEKGDALVNRAQCDRNQTVFFMNIVVEYFKLNLKVSPRYFEDMCQNIHPWAKAGCQIYTPEWG